MGRTAVWRSSTRARPGGAAEGTRRVVVGRIRGAHGLRGQIRVQYFTDAADTLVGLPSVTIARAEDDPETQAFEVEFAGPGRRGEVRMALAGIRKREAAEELRGRLVLADPKDFEPLGPGEHYGFELVGCRVETRDGRTLGRVRDIWPTGAADLLIVEGEGGREHLIPAARDLLREVDVERRRIVVEVIPGLLDP
jgi:16S rRNA processing protein RimM